MQPSSYSELTFDQQSLAHLSDEQIADEAVSLIVAKYSISAPQASQALQRYLKKADQYQHLPRLRPIAWAYGGVAFDETGFLECLYGPDGVLGQSPVVELNSFWTALYQLDSSVANRLRSHCYVGFWSKRFPTPNGKPSQDCRCYWQNDFARLEMHPSLLIIYPKKRFNSVLVTAVDRLLINNAIQLAKLPPAEVVCATEFISHFYLTQSSGPLTFDLYGKAYRVETASEVRRGRR